MRAYWIDVPYVSANLKRSYKKKLEVYSGEVAEDGGRVTADVVHRFLRGKWVEKTCNGQRLEARYDYRTRKHINLVPYTTMPTLDIMKTGCAYATLEMAQAAKLILLQDMTRMYEKELEELRELLKKNVPDTEKPLKDLKDEYPEYFI